MSKTNQLERIPTKIEKESLNVFATFLVNPNLGGVGEG